MAILMLHGCKDKYGIDYFDQICKDSLGFNVDSSTGSLAYPIKLNNKYLSLRDISYPSDTFFFRLEYSKDATLKIFEYSFYKKRTVYKTYSFPLEFPVSGRILFDNKKDRLADFTQTFISSEARDKRFIEELEMSGLLESSSNFGLSGYPPPPYVHSYIVQFSNACHYGIFSLGDIVQNSKEFTEAQHFGEFLKYLKGEFGF